MNARTRLSWIGAIAVAMAGISAGVAVGQTAEKPPLRYGAVIGLRPEKIAEYKRLHAAIWPEIAKANHEANVRNYSIYLRKLPDGNYYLFSYFEYVGNDFAADMKRMKSNPDVRRWWALTDPCQKPLADRKPGEWWASMEEVFHQD